MPLHIDESDTSAYDALNFLNKQKYVWRSLCGKEFTTDGPFTIRAQDFYLAKTSIDNENWCEACVLLFFSQKNQ